MMATANSTGFLAAMQDMLRDQKTLLITEMDTPTIRSLCEVAEQPVIRWQYIPIERTKLSHWLDAAGVEAIIFDQRFVIVEIQEAVRYEGIYWLTTEHIVACENYERMRRREKGLRQLRDRGDTTPRLTFDGDDDTGDP